MQLAYILFLLFPLSICTTTLNITGSGEANPLSVLNQWGFSFHILKRDTRVSYTVLNGSVAIDNLLTDPPTIDFAAVDGILALNDSRIQGKGDQLQFIPFLADSVSVLYNLPSLNYTDGRTETPRLMLSRDVVADIFRGKVNYWRHPNILKVNPDVDFPDLNITFVVRGDHSPTTSVFTGALSMFVNNWQWEAGSTIPDDIKSISNCITAYESYGARAAVEGLEGSITYMTYSDVINIGILKTTSLIENRDGYYVGPEEQYVIAAQENIENDKGVNSFVPFVDLHGTDSYPIVSLTYLILSNSVKDCNRRRELFKWMYWSVTDDVGSKLDIELGYSPLSQTLNNLVVSFLTTYECNGSPVLNIIHDQQHTGAGYDFFLILAMILLCLSIIMGGLWHYFNQSRCNKIVMLYQTLLMFGIALTYISVIFWYKIPATDTTCLARMWLTCLGYTLILVAMFERTWQIRRVYGRIVKGGSLTSKVTGCLEIGGGILVLSVVQVLILSIWTGIDSYKAVYELTDTINFEAKWECNSKHINTWIALETTYFLVLLFWGIYVVYSTWSIKNAVIESRWILISMYNNVLLIALIIALFVTVKLDDNFIFYIIVPAIEISTTNVAIASFVPIILVKLKILYTSSRDSSHTAKSVTSSKVANSTEMNLNY